MYIKLHTHVCTFGSRKTNNHKLDIWLNGHMHKILAQQNHTFPKYHHDHGPTKYIAHNMIHTHYMHTYMHAYNCHLPFVLAYTLNCVMERLHLQFGLSSINFSASLIYLQYLL